MAHILPNSIAPILVAVTLSVGSIILYRSVLSFLGYGIRDALDPQQTLRHSSNRSIRSSPSWKKRNEAVLI